MIVIWEAWQEETSGEKVIKLLSIYGTDRTKIMTLKLVQFITFQANEPTQLRLRQFCE